MNEHTRQLIYFAYNIDQSSFRPNPPGKGKRSWRDDPNIDGKHQLDNEYYKDRKTRSGATIHNLSLLDNHGCLIDYVLWSKHQLRRVAEGKAFLFDNQNN